LNPDELQGPDQASCEKKLIIREPKAVVAQPSQSPGINASALPRSNQIDATMFD
jgi:hypothetical protein